MFGVMEIKHRPNVDGYSRNIAFRALPCSFTVLIKQLLTPDVVVEFCKQNDAIFDNDKADKEKLVKKLSGEIKERSVAIFGVSHMWLLAFIRIHSHD